MLGFFKNLFGSGGSAESDHANGHPHPASTPPPPAPAMPGAAYAESAPAFNEGPKVHVSLQSAISALPLELKSRVMQPAPADVFVSLPVESVVQQLQTGAVKISFGQLRAAAPGIFTPQDNFDRVQVALPLAEILPQINPALLTRRGAQKHIEVPEEVRGPFGNDCHGVSFSSAATTTGTVLPASPAPAPEPAAPTAPVAHDPVPMIPAEPIPFRKSIVSTPTPRPPSATPSGPPPARPPLPATRGLGATSSTNSTSVPFPMPPKPSNGHNGHNGSNGHGLSLRPEPAPANAPLPESYIMVPLAALSERWPEALRLEIGQLNLSQAQLALPSSMIEPALKQGKIVFSWKMVRSWVRPAPLPTVSAHDGVMLELPLPVIAPLFFGRKAQAGQGRRKVQVDENIPNLFFGFPQGDSAAPAAPEPVAPITPIAPSKTSSASAESEDLLTPIPFNKAASSQETNFYVWGDTADTPQVDPSEFKRTVPGTDFLSRYATPNEVVTRAVGMDGVAGALVALPDGLMVASKLPTDVNGDTLAAFLPQIFGKVSQCTKELRMGELNNLNFTVGNVPWKIFRVNAIFFAAFGRAGQGLPTAQLAALAGELNRKK